MKSSVDGLSSRMKRTEERAEKTTETPHYEQHREKRTGGAGEGGAVWGEERSLRSL